MAEALQQIINPSAAIPPETLGNDVVRRHLAKTYQIVHGAELESEITADIHEEVSKVREQVGSYTGSAYQVRLDGLIDAVAPEFLRFQCESAMQVERQPQSTEGGSLPWTAWIARKPEGATQQVVFDLQVLNFLQWHTQRIKELNQSEAVTEIFEQQARVFTAGVRRGEEEGWLVRGAAKTATRRVCDPIVCTRRIVDEFDTVVRDRVAYVWAPIEGISVGSSGASIDRIGTVIELVEETAVHEYIHYGLGFLPARWITEATTEHLAEVFKGERHIDDLSSGLEYEVYEDERKLLAVLLDVANFYKSESSPALSMRHLTLAYSEQLSPNKKDTQHLAFLEKRLDTVFGCNIIQVLEQRINQRCEELCRLLPHIPPRDHQIHAIKEITYRLDASPELYGSEKSLEPIS